MTSCETDPFQISRIHKNPLVWSKQHTSLGPTLFHFQLWLDLVFKLLTLHERCWGWQPWKGAIHIRSLFLTTDGSVKELPWTDIGKCYFGLLCIIFKIFISSQFPLTFARYKPDRCHHCRVAFGRDEGGSLSTEQEMLWKCYEDGDNSHKSERSNNGVLEPLNHQVMRLMSILWVFSSDFQTTAIL